MSMVQSAWRLLTGLSLDRYLLLADWHQWAVLIALGILASFGLHYLLGYVFRFYRRGGRMVWWIPTFTLPALTASVAALLGAYLLATGSAGLVGSLVGAPPEQAARLGQVLLGPAFERIGEPSFGQPADPGAAENGPPENGQAESGLPEERPPEAALPRTVPPRSAPPAADSPEDGLESPAAADSKTLLSHARLSEVLRAIPVDDLRAALGGDPDGAPLEEAGTPGAADVVMTLAREWISDPDQSWPEWIPAPGEASVRAADDDALVPAEFILSLVGEIEEDAVLPQADWAYVAGTRFEQRVLAPLFTDYLHYAAIAVAIAVAVFNLVFFWLMVKAKRRPPLRLGRRRASSEAPPPVKAGESPPPVPSATANSTGDSAAESSAGGAVAR